MGGSEQALAALERSGTSSILLLDEVSRIASIEFNTSTETYQGARNSAQFSKESDFREQWILRLLLKRAHAALEDYSKDVNRQAVLIFLTSTKLWALLHYLLTSIKRQALLDILFERSFTKIISGAGRVIFKSQILHLAALEPVLPVNPPVFDRPSKRRRLHPPAKAEVDYEQKTSSPQTQSFLRLLKVVEVFGLTLQDETETGVSPSRPVDSACCGSVEEATSLLCLILEITQYVVRFSKEPNNLKQVNMTVPLWLELWHNVSAAAVKTKAFTIAKTFNETCLEPALDLLLELKHSYKPEDDARCTAAIERGIAKYTILPLRSAFIDRHAIEWNTSRSVLSWVEIEPVYNTFREQLGTYLQVDNIAGIDLISLNNSEHAAALVSIASRIIPKADQRRRQRERSWFEALVVTLAHLAFAKDMYKLRRDQDGILRPFDPKLPASASETESPFPDRLFEIIREERIDLSLPVSSYLISAVLQWRNGDISVTTQAHLITLDVDAFLPQIGNGNCEVCLESLINLIEQRQTPSASKNSEVVTKMILPIMRAFSRARDLKSFMEIWQTQLENELRLHLTNDAAEDETPLARVWSDEEVFLEFRYQCQLQTEHNFGFAFIKDTVGSLKLLPTRLGSTLDVIAKVACAECVMKARNISLPPSSVSEDLIHDGTAALVECLCQNTDYQGQRWRLWSLLATFCSLGRKPYYKAAFEGIMDQFRWNSLLKLATLPGHLYWSQPAFLMEHVRQFSFVIHLASFDTPEWVDELDAATQHFRLLLKSTKKELLLCPSWDGRLSSMNSLESLISALLGELLQNKAVISKKVASSLHQSLSLLVFDRKQIFRGEVTDEVTIGQQIEVILMSLTKLDFEVFSKNLVGYFAEAKITEVPDLLLHFPIQQLSRRRAKELAGTILEKADLVLSAKPETGSDAIITLTALLSRLILAHEVSIGKPENFEDLRLLTDRVWAIPNADVRSIALFHLLSILEVSALRFNEKSAVGRHRGLTREMFRWCKEIVMANHIELDSIVWASLLLETISRNDKDPDDAVEFEQTRKRLHNLLDTVQIRGDDTEFLHSYRRWSLSSYSVNDSPQNGGEHRSTSPRLTGQIKHETLVRMALNAESLKFSKHVGVPTPSPRTDDQMQAYHHDEVQIFMNEASRILHHAHGEVTGKGRVAIELLSKLQVDQTSKATSILGVVFRLEQMAMVLELHPGVVNQSMIDSFLQELTRLLCSASFVSPSPASLQKNWNVPASAVYDRITKVTNVLLARYRRRLNGRTHLLLPLLQNMLRCLFYTPNTSYIYLNPATERQKQLFRSSLPHWLLIGNREPLPLSSADMFTRILSSICNPTTASARSAHKTRKQRETQLEGLELNDETKKARKIAGQYMQYLIMEYARCTLDGIIAPQVRDKLMPGMYAVLDCLDRDLMRNMNEAMDASSRAIFKGLYDDWMKFGKWDQS